MLMRNTLVAARHRGVIFGTALTALTALWIAVAGPASALGVPDRPQSSVAFNAEVRAVAYHQDVIFVGGRFTAARDGQTTPQRSRLAAVSASDGALLDWAPRTDGAVQAIAVAGDSVYLGGDFGRVNGERREGLAKVHAETGELDEDFAPAVGGRVLALEAAHDRLYVAGSLYEIDGAKRGSAGAVALDTGALDEDWRPDIEGSVRTIAADSSRVYLGGSFSELNGSEKHGKLAAVDPATGGTDTSFAPKVWIMVRDLAVTSGQVYGALGGEGGRLASYGSDGTEQWAVTADGDFQAVTVLGETIYAGGHFTEVCNTARTGPNGDCVDGSEPRGRLAAVDASGRLLAWAPQADSAIGVLAMASNPDLRAVAVGGTFTTFGSGRIDQPYFAHFR
ncbi:MAG: hypothetical protein GEU94_12520 [Micromonosporaceae bacterium]|nr:hypothetical protein [Micromonosporaceae bacterium]